MAAKQQVIPIVGGLDLTTDKLSVSPGTAQACLNYEVGINRGIRRVDGFSRWDGRFNFAIDGIGYSITGFDASATAWEVGDIVSVTYDDTAGNLYTQNAVIVSVTATQEGGNYQLDAIIVFTNYQALQANFDQIYTVTGVTTFATQRPGSGAPVATFSAVASAYSALVTALPGDSMTRVPGLHFFNDKLFAIVDLVALQLTPATAPMPLEGAPIYTSTQAPAIGTLALARTVEGTPADVIWELFDYGVDDDLGPGTLLYTPTVTANLARNGNFFTAVASATDWTTPLAGWTYSTGAAGVATAAAGAAPLTHALAGVAGYSYEITYTITVSAGQITSVGIGGATSATPRTASGTYTDTVTATGTGVLTITPNGAFIGTVDDVSVRIVAPDLVGNGDFSSATGWTAGAGWSIGSGVATGANTSSTLTKSLAAVSGLTYRVQFTLTVTSGSIIPTFGGVTGTSRGTGGTFVSYITASGTGNLIFTGTSFTGTLDDVSVVLVDHVGTMVAHVAPERAALYCANWDSEGGWTRRDLGRQLEYVETSATDASAFFLPYIRRGFISQIDDDEVLDTGWIGSDGLAEDIGGGNTSWSGLDAGNLQADDLSEAGDSGSSLALRTNTLKATFSAEALQIPAGALVRGIEVRVYRRAQTGAKEELVTIGCTSTASRSNKADVTRNLPVVAAGGANRDQTYGGEDDVWGNGLTDLKPSDINDGGFNVQLAFRLQGGALSSVFVDAVQVKVYYQEQTRKAYVNNSGGSPWDQEIEVIHYTVSEGSATTSPAGGDRRGLLVINSAVGTAYTRPWLFGPDMGIYTEDDRGGALLAYCASTDEPITLASSYAVAVQDARYVFCSANPYASDQYDVTFIVNGAEHGHMFDGTYLLPIQTGLLAQFEKPRHVAWAGTYLALGYNTGSISVSDVGDPLVYVDAASLAAEIGAGDRITGLIKLKGNSLGVFTESTIFAIQGTDPSTGLERVEISSSSGAIEYSVLNIGQPVFLDFGGPATLSTTDQYGDFSSGRLAEGATPWFLERLQLPTRNQTTDKTFVGGYVMRSKRQCRYVFADGWQATLTFTPNDGVQVTTQRFYGDWTERDTSAIKALGVCHGTTSTGQDVAFMTFDRDPESSRYRYVFQLDAGRSFDGEEIISQWVSQPLQMGPPFYRKQLDQLGVHGRAYGYGKFKVFKSFDYSTPVSDETTAASSTGTWYEFGVSGGESAVEGPYKAIHTLRGEGEDVTILIESISASVLPHTIQNLVVRYTPEDPKA